MPGTHRIAGVPSALGDDWFQPTDPRTGQPVADRFPEATVHEVSSAVDQAVASVPDLSTMPSPTRGEFFHRLADQLARQGARLVAQADVETGLGRDHLGRELDDAIHRLRQLAADVIAGEDVSAMIANRGRSRTMRVGRGPVVAFGSSVSPFVFGVPGADAMTALAAGCPVIHKSAPVHPATSEAIAAIVDGMLASGGWPAGAHGLLHGRRAAVGEELVAADGIAGVAYTGPYTPGRGLFDLAMARSQPASFHATFTSANPVVVTTGALRSQRDVLADHIAGAVTRAGGQGPVRPGVVVVPVGVDGDWFIDALADRLRAAGPHPMLTADLHATFATGVARRSAVAGVTSIVERIIDASGGYAQDPVLLAAGLDDFLASALLCEPCVGPLLVVVQCEDERMTEALGGLHGALVGGLYTDLDHDDPDMVRTLARAMTSLVGRLVVNEPMRLPVPGARAMHGGPWPAASDVAWTSLGPDAIRRWQRPVTFEGCLDALLPPPLQDANPWSIVRTVDGSPTTAPLSTRT